MSTKTPPGIAIIVSGPSGVGKDTVIDRWRELDPSVERVVAYTTREPRPGEINGVAYWFVSRERFHELIDQNHFLEHKEVHGNFYGTPFKDLQEMISAGKKAILKIDVQGAVQVMAEHPDILSIFLLPPSTEELLDRLRKRGTEDAEKLAERVKNAEEEIEHSQYYKHKLVNTNIEDCVREIVAIVEEECRILSSG